MICLFIRKEVTYETNHEQRLKRVIKEGITTGNDGIEPPTWRSRLHTLPI